MSRIELLLTKLHINHHSLVVMTIMYLDSVLCLPYHLRVQIKSHMYADFGEQLRQ